MDLEGRLEKRSSKEAAEEGEEEARTSDRSFLGFTRERRGEESAKERDGG